MIAEATAYYAVQKLTPEGKIVLYGILVAIIAVIVFVLERRKK
jgi:t-SNARE complex subunit (syntaxin)